MSAAMLSSRVALCGSCGFSRRASLRTRAQRAVAVRAAARPLWLPGSTPPPYLTGELPGDFGFDPLKLGADPSALKWYQQAELVHCRWSMLGVAGILATSLLTKLGLISAPEWYDAGLVAQESSAIPFATLLVIEHILVGFVEAKRLQDILSPGSQSEPGSFLGLEGALKGKEVGYPGGLFDPLGLSNSDQYATFKLREIKNGRLAMLACLGFTAQYYATGKGPLDNLADHLANPWANNFTTNGVSLPFLK